MNFKIEFIINNNVFLISFSFKQIKHLNYIEKVYIFANSVTSNIEWF